MSSFEEKVVIVTGAAGGIGRATAARFAAEGATVVAVDVDDERGKETLQLIQTMGGHGLYIHTDVSDMTQVEQLIGTTLDRYGRLDCAFNNAAILGETGNYVADYSVANWERILKIDLTGIFLCCKYEVAAMLKAGGGAIVNTSSSIGLVGDRGCVGYAAAKHGVVGITRAVALEYATENIRVNAIAPGIVRTAMIESFIAGDASVEAKMLEREPIGRMAQADEVAAAVVWLCSHDASFVTGHTLSVDGGQVVAP